MRGAAFALLMIAATAYASEVDPFGSTPDVVGIPAPAMWQLRGIVIGSKRSIAIVSNHDTWLFLSQGDRFADGSVVSLVERDGLWIKGADGQERRLHAPWP